MACVELSNGVSRRMPKECVLLRCEAVMWREGSGTVFSRAPTISSRATRDISAGGSGGLGSPARTAHRAGARRHGRVDQFRLVDRVGAVAIRQLSCERECAVKSPQRIDTSFEPQVLAATRHELIHPGTWELRWSVHLGPWILCHSGACACTRYHSPSWCKKKKKKKKKKKNSDGCVCMVLNLHHPQIRVQCSPSCHA